MASILKEIFTPHLSTLGFSRSRRTNQHAPCGLSYDMSPDLGTGSFWIYPIADSCVISMFQAVFKKTVSFRLSYPPFLYFGLFKNEREQIAKPNGWPSNGVTGYVGHGENDTVEMIENAAIRSVGIAMTRDFCENNLPQGRGNNFRSLVRAASRLDNTARVPELTTAFHQLASFRPDLSVAGMYYESKVMELLSYVLQWSLQADTPPVDIIPARDRAFLQKIESHLRDNYVSPAGLPELASMACMSQNKLTALFKRVHGQTITQYVQSLRLDRARELLLHSDLKIETIANRVGYRHHGSFTDLFKRATGTTPHEFRVCNPGKSAQTDSRLPEVLSPELLPRDATD